MVCDVFFILRVDPRMGRDGLEASIVLKKNQVGSQPAEACWITPIRYAE